MTRDATDGLRESLENLDHALADFKSGRDSAYLTVATELRKILTDTYGALLRRALPEATLERIRPLPLELDGHEVWAPRISATLSVGGVGRAPRPVLFRIPIVPDDEVTPDDWLEDWILDPSVMVREIIQKAGSQDGAHFDEKLSTALMKAGQYVAATSAGQPIDTLRLAVVALGDYVSARLHDLLGT